MAYRRILSAMVLGLMSVSSVWGGEPLPLPVWRIPEMPPYPSLVITAGGQRLLFSATDVEVRWNPHTKRLEGNHPGWWLINYPWSRIGGLAGKGDDEIATTVIGAPAAQVRNWYLRLPGTPTAEPAPPTGPAPIFLTPTPTLFVDVRNPMASDKNDGTAAHPFQNISGAIPHLVAGSVVRVLPGVYREMPVFPTSLAGTSNQPIVVEGVRDANGNMPVITGNDAAPADAWKPFEGQPGVYRAAFFTKQAGPVSVDGVTLHEVSWLEDLKGGDDLINTGSTEMLHPKTAQQLAALAWQKKMGTEIQLGSPGTAAVYYASTWVWVDAPADKPAAQDGQPRIVNQLAGSGGPSQFRLYRQTGLGLYANNRMRGWVNGVPLPAAYVPGMPRASHDPGIEHWQDFTFHEGWNRLVFLLDTTQKPTEVTWNFHWLGKMISSADKPADLSKKPQGTPDMSVTEWNVAGPFPATPDNAVYVRLQNDADPNAHVVDMAARGCVVQIQSSYLHLRGFEIRDGASYFQNGQLSINCAQGVLVEGCRFTGAEIKSIIALPAFQNQLSAPTVLLGNWVESPGVTGISIPDNSEPPPGTKADLRADENTTVNGRMRVWSEYNRVINNNASGYSRWDESGGFKSLMAVGCLYRGNEIMGGDGPGMWFDWANYNNRIEGNLFVDNVGFGVGVEASPGPNLVANNLIVGNKHGGGPFFAAICTWSSHGLLAVNNTCDGRWVPSRQDGMFGSGVAAFMTHEGPNDRGTAWGSLPKRDCYLIDNFTVGYPAFEFGIYGPGNFLTADYTDAARNGLAMLDGFHGAANSPFVDATQFNYRLKPGHPAERSGVEDERTALVTHDFYGLPRGTDVRRSVGAFRADPRPRDAKLPQLEIEWQDGRLERRNENLTLDPPGEVVGLADAIAISTSPFADYNYFSTPQSVGAQVDPQAIVPVTWQAVYFQAANPLVYEVPASLLQTNAWHEYDSPWVPEKKTFAVSPIQGGLWHDGPDGVGGVGICGQHGVQSTVVKPFRALVYIHVQGIGMWNKGDFGHVALLRIQPDGKTSMLWETRHIGAVYDNLAFIKPVDLNAGDRLVTCFLKTLNGGPIVDLRIGLLPPKMRPEQ